MCAVPSASASGRLRQGNAGHGRGDPDRRAFMSTILYPLLSMLSWSRRPRWPVRGRPYSTISFLRLWTNVTTSRCSASGTWNFAKVAPAWPRNTLQSLSLMRMPRWQSAMSLPR